VDSEKVNNSSATPTNGNVVSFAHEINNPLAALLNILHLVESEALTERGQHYLKLAREEIQRISQLTHSALAQSKQMAVLEYTNLPDLMRSVLDVYASRFESRGIEVKTRFCRNGSLACDPGALRRTFSNLLLNAADAMPNGGKVSTRVSVAQEWTGQKRHGLRLTVADNGCGIPGDYLPRVLEPFFTTKGKSGTGVGLSVVRDTVQKHRGVLRVRSCTRSGRSGSVFSIFLPSTSIPCRT
jgi:signal transduction histidine kinase